jgi:outer membrane protease
VRKLVYATLFPALMLVQPAVAAGNIRISVSPVLTHNSGTTEYTLRVGGRLKSQLEFPVDVALAGGQLEIRKTINNGGEWAVRARVLTSVNDPGEKMLDHDWLDNIKFSFTESNAEARVTILDVDISKSIVGSERFGIALMAGFMYEKISQDIIGFKGWQLNPFDTSRIQVSVSGSGLALLYDVTYKLPQIGLLPSAQIGKKLRIEGKVAIARVFVSDVDDHVLRKKLSVADGPGTGVLSHIGLRYALKETERRDMFVELIGEYISIKADMSQKQTWYGNDPADDFIDPDTGELVVNDNTGDVIVGIDHAIRSTQYRIGLRIGLSFH